MGLIWFDDQPDRTLNGSNSNIQTLYDENETARMMSPFDICVPEDFVDMIQCQLYKCHFARNMVDVCCSVWEVGEGYKRHNIS